MKTLYLLMAIVPLASGCSILEHYYDDDFKQSSPSPHAFTKVYPGIAEFQVYQDIPSTIELPADSFINSVAVTKFLSAQNSVMHFFTKMYGEPRNTGDSLLLFQLSESAKDTEVISLGFSVRTLLDASNVEVKILDAGTGISGQPQCRGYYRGTYLQTLASTPVGIGRVEGFVGYDGELVLEFNNTKDFNRMTGYGIDGMSGDFVFSGAFLVNRNDTLDTIVDTLHVDTDALHASLKMSSSGFDTLTINLLRIK